MSLLIFGFRKIDIIRQKNDLNYRLMNLTKKLSDLQQYSANIGDGSVSMFDMMNTPASMFNRQMMFSAYSHQMALAGSQQNFMMMSPMINMQMQQMDPNSQAMYQQWIFKNLYQQQKERINKVEQKLLNQQETQIQQEKAKIESQLKMLDQELQSVTEAEGKAIENWKPNYVA